MPLNQQSDTKVHSEMVHIEARGNGNGMIIESDGNAGPTRRSAGLGRQNTGISTSSAGPFTLQRARRIVFTPEKPVGPAPTCLGSIRSILLASWLNVLLVFIPVSWALHFAKKDDTVVFIFSFLAVIPLARLVAFATDDISMRVGETPANLINTSFRNTAVLIIAITALLKCELQIVQSSLVGSILNKILLTPGMCFFAGGIKYSEQGFGAAATQIDSSMLTISVIAVLLPAAFHLIVNLQGQNPSDAHENQEILKMSHGVAILLLISYLGYLIFQLYSHSTLYSDQAVSSKSTKYTDKKRMDEETGTVQSPNVTRTGIVNNSTFVHSLEEAEKEEMPQMSLLMALALLAVVTVLIAVTAEWLVDAITEMTVELEEMARTNSRIISRDFISIILLPIVGNAAEYVPAITVSVKDKLALSLGEAVASSIQTALSIIPFTVLIAWMMGKPLTLLFDPYESITLFLAVIVFNQCIKDGRSNWLKGLMLMLLYVIIATTFWFYPGQTPVARGLQSLQCS